MSSIVKDKAKLVVSLDGKEVEIKTSKNEFKEFHVDYNQEKLLKIESQPEFEDIDG